MSNPFMHVSGENFVLDNRKVVLRGFGIGNWMNTEHFMTRMPGTDHQKRKVFRAIYGGDKADDFFESYLSDYITEADFVFLKSLGINAVRLPFSYRRFEDDQRPGCYRKDGFRHLDRVLKYCEKFNIWAILDLHAVPGGQNPDTHADSNLGESKFWDDASFRNRMVDLWTFIADHYKDNQWVAAYDLVNEPVNVPDPEVFNDFFDKAVAAVRKVDPHHILFLEGDHWAQDFSMFHQPRDPQIAYSFHYYPTLEPQSYLPGKNEIAKGLEPLIQIRERFHRPLWCGETGSLFPEGRAHEAYDLIRNTLDILEENGVSWSLWSYKDAQAMGLVYPNSDTPWMKFVSELNWQHTNETQFAETVFDFFETSGHFAEIPEPMRDRLRFRLRGAFHHLYLEQMLIPKLKATPWAEMKKLPASFLWDNCGFHQEIADLVKSYTGR